MSRANERAFPVDAHTANEPGLTIREHFAAMAMQGMVTALTRARPLSRFANGVDTDFIIENQPNDVAQIAVAYADALIAEIAKVKP